MWQETLMKYDPTNGKENPYPSHARQYRKYHGTVAWLYCPWTGVKRDPRDIGSDTFGQLIQPPGEVLQAAVEPLRGAGQAFMQTAQPLNNIGTKNQN